jgi:hypothetical protein
MPIATARPISPVHTAVMTVGGADNGLSGAVSDMAKYPKRVMPIGTPEGT